ncbi:hypothetical protein M1247_14530 [Mycobacterium sp. 21AC1]|uniref:hypothetical protein n=1 Tax=[Mycobacterium] appelbergii TaxID=2939269 RepID=UPI0029392E2B|nr:hypothetical protein [Mycobacterium sp. 21AC1]MDV3126138.1 hypothetical protein [Mycobacterium sp. 21AC1]
MAGQRECDPVVTSGRLAKANEFFDAAEHLEERHAERGRESDLLGADAATQ